MTKKKTRKAFSKRKTIDTLNRILDKFTILDLRMSYIAESFACKSEDIEDNTHYILSQKKKCDAILTNNVSDFAPFDKMIKISPQSSLAIVTSIVD